MYKKQIQYFNIERGTIPFLFSFKGRSGRLAIFGLVVSWFLFGLALGVMIDIAQKTFPLVSPYIITDFAILSAQFLQTVSVMAVFSRRLHDINLPFWLSFAYILVPAALILSTYTANNALFNFVLYFQWAPYICLALLPGHKGQNAYGDPWPFKWRTEVGLKSSQDNAT